MNTAGRYGILLVIILLLNACAVPPPEQQPSARASGEAAFREPLALPQQQPPPQDIQSVSLHPEGNPAGAPVVTLGGNEQLVLSFDYLDNQNRQFSVEVSYRTQTWEESNLPASAYLESFFKTYIQSSEKSFTERPSYYHVEYTFPNPQLNPSQSGNYLLEVYNYEGTDLLFSLPFFISEDEGVLQTRIERLFAQRQDGRSLDQPFSTYRYPPFIDFPQFDLSLSYVPLPFWGHMRKADQVSTITPGQLTGNLNRSAAFVADRSFLSLDLTTLQADGREILEYQPAVNPPKVILQRDVQHLESTDAYWTGSDFHSSFDERQGNYAQVAFTLETDSTVTTNADIYIVGEFNNWMIQDKNKMSYNRQTNLWEGQALVKQGQYPYTYIMTRNGALVNLFLGLSAFSIPQRYLTFIYFKDPTRNFDRLLQVELTTK